MLLFLVVINFIQHFYKTFHSGRAFFFFPTLPFLVLSVTLTMSINRKRTDVAICLFFTLKLKMHVIQFSVFTLTTSQIFHIKSFRFEFRNFLCNFFSKFELIFRETYIFRNLFFPIYI